MVVAQGMAGMIEGGAQAESWGNGVHAFECEADRLAQLSGARLSPPKLLREMATKGAQLCRKRTGQDRRTESRLLTARRQ
jgi:hypothetical protein